LIFTRTIAENFVLSARLLPSGKQVLVNKVDAAGIKANTYLEFNDLSSEEPFSSVFREDALYPAIWFMGDGSAFAAGDSEMIYLDTEGKLKWEKKYPNGAVFSSNVCLGKYPVAAVADDNTQNDTGSGGISVNIMNAEGDVITAYPVESEVSSIEACSDVIAVSMGREVTFINTRGKTVGRFTAKNEIKRVFFFDKNEAAIVAKDNISIVKIG
jgi:hypothetical protein